jgi:hypothetical protein
MNNWFSNNSDALLNAGLSLLSGRNAQEQMAGGLGGFVQARKDAKQKNKTLEMLQGKSPEIAQAIEAGILSPMDGYKLHLENGKSDRTFKTLDDGTFGWADAKTGTWTPIGKAPKAGSDKADEYGLNPQYGIDANNNPVILQLSKGGTSKQTALPEGVTLSKEPIKLDAGTHFVLLDPITRQPIGQIPKDLAGAERQKEIGTAEGKSIAAASGDLQAGQNAKALIQDLRSDPNRERGTGMSSVFNAIPGTAGYDFQTKVDQARSGAFLTAIQQMRGLGALSNAEGQTATEAVTRMKTATSEPAFLEALDAYETIIDQGIARAQSKLPQAGGGADGQTGATPDIDALVNKYGG